MRSNKELEQFAYIASHDLKEPLRMIGSYSKLLKRKFDPTMDQRAKEYMAERLIKDYIEGPGLRKQDAIERAWLRAWYNKHVD